MSIKKFTVVDRVEVLELGQVQVRRAVRIVENGVVVSQTFERSVVVPGDDYSNEDARVQAICSATHTPEVIEAFKAAIAAQGV